MLKIITLTALCTICLTTQANLQKIIPIGPFSLELAPAKTADSPNATCEDGSEVLVTVTTNNAVANSEYFWTIGARDLGGTGLNCGGNIADFGPVTSGAGVTLNPNSTYYLCGSTPQAIDVSLTGCTQFQVVDTNPDTGGSSATVTVAVDGSNYTLDGPEGSVTLTGLAPH